MPADVSEPFRLLSTHVFGDVSVRYLVDDDDRVTLRLVPLSRTADLPVRRTRSQGSDTLAAEPLVHLAIGGDPQPGGFAAGRTMRWAPAALELRLLDQDVVAGAVVTRLASDRVEVEHRLAPVSDDEPHTLAQTTTVTNTSGGPVSLELLTSFSLGGLTAFAGDDGPGRMRVHRFASSWSDEARAVDDSVEHLGLEPSWSSLAAVSVRFGQVGTMPVRGWHPTVAVSDDVAGVVWGARLGWAGSWQLEVARRDDDLGVSGGLADRELGHWRRTLQPGESLVGPPAWLSVAEDVDEVWHRLLAADRVAVQAAPAGEADLPVVFNEWCTTWGEPQHDQVVRIADAVAPLGVRYLVIDAGWYRPDDGEHPWYSSHGDWVPSARLFPEGIEATAAAIRDRGLVPGLWFELEVVGVHARAFEQTDHLLRRDGAPLTTGVRRFWDLQDPWAHAYLRERVHDRLRDAGFGYLKIDYNESIGIGCDHPDGIGEGLRQQVLGVYTLVESLAAAVPGLVVENCASGGHRLEPSMLHRTAMSSFSDAHESADIPLIAASLHRLVLPRQSQVWAVLHASDDDDRLVWSLAAGFLGRLCLSGDVLDLSPQQLEVVATATGLYRSVAHLIRDGRSQRLDATGPSRRHPTGWQAVTYRHGEEALVVVHAFADAPDLLEVPLPAGDWEVDGRLVNAMGVEPGVGALRLRAVTPFSAAVVRLRRIATGNHTPPG